MHAWARSEAGTMPNEANPNNHIAKARVSQNCFFQHVVLQKLNLNVNEEGYCRPGVLY